MKETLKDRLKTFSHVFVETLPFYGVIFVLNPILIALLSHQSLDYQFSFFILGLAYICVGILTAFPISFFPNKYRQIAIAFLRSLFLVFFIVSIFHAKVGSQFDGFAAADRSVLYYFVLYFFYTTAVIVLTLLFLRGKIILRNLYVAFSVLGFAFVAYYPFQLWVTSKPQTYYSDQTNLSFASDRNIIVIFADMLQGSTLEQYFTIHPEEQINFQGFTLYSRATSPFPFTYYGAPAILTGKIYSNGSDKSSVQAMKEAETSSFMMDAVNSDFDSTTIGLDFVKLHDSQLSSQFSNPLGIAKILFALSLQRITKKSIHTLDLDPQMGLVGYKINSKEIMDRLCTAPIGKSKNKILFFHSFIPHAPIVFRREHLESMPLVPKPLGLTVENYWEEMAFFLGQLTHFLEHMKRIGIYDKSLIIVVGDHGHFIGQYEALYDYPGAEDFDGFQKGPWARTAAMYNAAVFIKPPMKKDSLQISRAASSTLGLRPLIKRYLTDETSDVLKDFKILGKNKVVVFKDDIGSNPYMVSNDHFVLEFTGNASSLADQFNKDTWRDKNILYKVGTKTTDICEYLDGYWIREKENGGAWLKGRPARLAIQAPDIERKSYKLQMDFSGLINEQHPEQRVRVWLNGNELNIFSITKPGKNLVELDIPINFLVSDGINEFKFEPLDAISPKEINAWDYSEPLSVFLYSLRLLESGAG